MLISCKNDILLVGINSKYIHPAMGIFSLKANCKYDANYIEYTIKDNICKIIEDINNSSAVLIGISTYIWNISLVKEIITKIENKIIVLGGPESSHDPQILYSLPNGYILRGEGEESFNELIDYLNGKLVIDEVSNLIYLNSSVIKYTKTKLPNLMTIKHDLSLIKDYKNRICYLESSRGCYYSCTYCLASTEKPVRFFPISEIKTNILFLLENRAKTIKFLDRSFNIKTNYTNDILSFIKEHDNLYSTFQFEINGDNLDDTTIEIINSMRKKMIRFEIGIQSTNEKTNLAINRKQNFEKLKNNILKIKDNVVIHTDLIAGLPYEDYNSFKKSYNDVFMLMTEELQLGLLKELKGTVLSKTKDKYCYEFSKEPPFEVIKNSYISEYELDKIRLVEKATDKFYNYGYFKKTINYLFCSLNLNPFETFLSVMEYITSKKEWKKYQFDELTKVFYESLSLLVQNKEELLYIIKKDYLTKTKMKPKIWWDYSITRDERKNIYLLFSNKYSLKIEELYRYAHLEKFGNCYYLINYKDNTEYEISI